GNKYQDFKAIVPKIASVQEEKPHKLGGSGCIPADRNSWKWTDARVSMATPVINTKRTCCITRYNKTTDQVV
ncbi:hypothetical protein LDENG_00123670, partial [Lucifuga dentata]